MRMPCCYAHRPAEGLAVDDGVVMQGDIHHVVFLVHNEAFDLQQCMCDACWSACACASDLARGQDIALELEPGHVPKRHVLPAVQQIRHAEVLPPHQLSRAMSQ